MIDKILQIAFSGILPFIGMVILICLPVHFAIQALTIFVRFLLVSRHGWPPSHLDADGDFHQQKQPAEKIYLFSAKETNNPKGDRTIFQVVLSSEILLHNIRTLHKDNPEFFDFKVWTNDKKFVWENDATEIYEYTKIQYIKSYKDVKDNAAIAFLKQSNLL